VSAALAIAALLALASVAQEGERREVEVKSESGRFVARIHKAAGQERVAEALARWRLTVEAVDGDGQREAVWSCVVQHRPGERTYFVGDDGLAVVEVDPQYDSKRDLVRVWREERELVDLDATALGLEHKTGAWLAPENGARVGWLETPAGPMAQLYLRLADGGVRRVDLSTGRVFATHEWVTEIAVEPLVDDAVRAYAAPPYVKSASAPPSVAWGELLEVAIAGSHPTPNWRCVGVDARLEEGGATLVLAPLSAPPPKNSVQLQVLDAFDLVVRIVGLAPGRYSIRVVGRGDVQPEPLALEVTPARGQLELFVRGGILGLDDHYRVFTSGVAVFESSRSSPPKRFRVLDAQERALLQKAFVALPTRPKSSKSAGAADMFEYRLRWKADGKDAEWTFDDGTADAAGREIVRVLREAAAASK
jgi:hypothetical protein